MTVGCPMQQGRCAPGVRGPKKNGAPPRTKKFQRPPSPRPRPQNTMNLLLLGAASLPVSYLAYGYLSLFVPPK